MFQRELEEAAPVPNLIPQDERGNRDMNPNNYAYTQDGGGRYRAFHILFGLYFLIGMGVLFTILREAVICTGGSVPRNPTDLLAQFPELRVEFMNYMSEHLLVMPNRKVLNFAAFMNLLERSEDPLSRLDKWIHDSGRYIAHRLTYQTGAKFEPEYLGLRTIAIKDYIDSCVGDEATSNLLHFFFATCLIGWQTLKMFVSIVGPKNAGKSTVFKLIEKMFGSYSATFPPDWFHPSKEERLAKELFTSSGIRFLRIDELGKDSIFNEAAIKRVTGRDGIVNPFVTHSLRLFYPQCKFFCDSNYPLKPQYGTESTISDRTFYIPFRKVIQKDQRDFFFESRLATQENLDIYFTWLIQNYAAAAINGRLS